MIPTDLPGAFRMENLSFYDQPVPRPLSQMIAPATSISKTGSRDTHPYACLRCRARKIKCNKALVGCNNCKKTGDQCIYSARRTQKSHRIAQDVVVKILAPSPGKTEDTTSDDFPRSESSFNRTNEEGDNGDEELLVPREMREWYSMSTFDKRQSEGGKLFVAHGKSRYIDGGKVNQVANLEQILASEAGLVDGRTKSVPKACIVSKSTNESTSGSILFGMAHSKRDIRKDHPSPEIMCKLWSYYAQNVDLLVKVLYKPDVEALVMAASRDLEGLDVSADALLFAIYLATVTAMSNEECLWLHHEEKGVLLSRYHLALEHALVQAGWMMTQDIFVLQAIVLCWTHAPGQSSRSTWTLSGIAIGIAQAMGMHRDSASFSLSLKDTEVRRRIWWRLCVIDHRISEDCGLDNHIPSTMDTKLPLHVNDSDIALGAQEPLVERAEFTEMTMSLVKIEWTKINIKIKSFKCGKDALSSDNMKECVSNLINKYENTYIQYLDRSSYLQNLCYLGTRLIIAKLWKTTFDLCQGNNTTTEEEEEEMKERLLLYNVEVLKITHQLPDKSTQYGWMFLCKYTQWHAMAHILIELGNNCYKDDPNTEHAWAVMEAVFKSINEGDENSHLGNVQVKKSTLWPSLQKLFWKAFNRRKQAALENHMKTREVNDTFAHDSGCEMNSIRTDESVVVTPSTYEGHFIPTDPLLGDPFLGVAPQFDGETDWDNWHAFVQTFNTDVLLHSQDYFDKWAYDPSLTVGGW